jgi:hypothetical protein
MDLGWRRIKERRLRLSLDYCLMGRKKLGRKNLIGKKEQLRSNNIIIVI